MQHDLYKAECACGRVHVAPRPAGVPDSALSIGPLLRVLAVYLVVFEHVPVERCRQLIGDVAGAVVSEGFIHSCLARAASLVADVVALIRALITASPVAGFDETTLRSGPAGEKKYVHGAFTKLYSAFWLGARSLDSMEDAGILPEFAGIVVFDRYQNYFNPRWKRGWAYLDAGLGNHPAVPGEHQLFQAEILAYLIHRGLERDRIRGIARENVNADRTALRIGQWAVFDLRPAALAVPAIPDRGQPATGACHPRGRQVIHRDSAPDHESPAFAWPGPPAALRSGPSTGSAR